MILEAFELIRSRLDITKDSVIYKAYSNPSLKERSDRLIAEIEDGTKYVSMECLFNGFDYVH